MDNLLPPPPPRPPFPFVGPLPPLPPPSPPPPPDIPMPPKAPNAHRPSTAMKEYFNSEKHSDVTVRFGGKEVKAHKIALCSHSKFFAQCCEGQFEEASSNVIELKDDDPATVQAMLEHLYGIDYQEGDAKELLKSDSFSMPFHLRVYITADKYDVPSLKDEASSNFSLGARRVMKALRGSPTFKKQKKLTPHKMEEIDALASAIRVVFNNTGESDDLRETCTSVLLEHEFGLWRADEVMKNLFDDVPELAVSLAKRKFCLQSHKSLMTVQCPDCDKVFSSELPFWGGAHCISCGAWTSNWSRHEYYGSRPTTMSKFLHSSRWRFWNHIHFPRIRIHISRVRDSDVSDMSEV